jgi:hypothetical protein
VTDKTALDAIRGVKWAHVPDPVLESNSGNATLTSADVLAMRARYDGGDSVASLARAFPFTDRKNIDAVVKRRTWKHL